MVMWCDLLLGEDRRNYVSVCGAGRSLNMCSCKVSYNWEKSYMDRGQENQLRFEVQKRGLVTCTRRNALGNTGDHDLSNFNFRYRAAFPRLQAEKRRQ